MRKYIPRNPTSLIRDSYNNMLLRLTNRDFNRRRLNRRSWYCALFFHDGLDGVTEEFPDYVFDVGEDVGKGGVEVAREFDFWEEGGGTVGGGGEGCYFVPAARYYVGGVAFY